MKRKRTKQVAPYANLRDFLEIAIDGKHPLEEVMLMLDQIEQGIGLEGLDKAVAEKFQEAPTEDRNDPVYQRGYKAGYDRHCMEQGIDNALDDANEANRNSDPLALTVPLKTLLN